MLSNPRQGTTYINSLFHNFNNCLVLYEIFHNNKEYGICNNLKNKDLVLFVLHDNNITEFTNENYETELDKIKEVLFNFRTNFPSKFVTSIQKYCKLKNYDYLLFKIFSYHLPRGKLTNLLNKCDIIYHVTRNYLDTFISKNKAQITNQYKFYDSSKIKIEFNILDYEKYLEKSLEWEDYCQDKSFYIIKYDKFIELDFYKKINFLKNRILRDSNIKLKNNIKDSILVKQDKEKLYKNKINNYDEFYNYFKTKFNLELD